MSDDEIIEEDELDEDELDEDELDDDEDDEDDVATPARPSGDDDDDEDDDDVEADLDAILKDRIAAGDDEDDDEDDEQAAAKKPAVAPGDAEPVQARQENEFSCPHCFLLVNPASVVDGECPHCGGMV